MNMLNQKGVSLVQVLFISALLAALALIGTNIITDQKNAQKGAQTKDDVSILHQAVTNILQDKKHCTATLIANSGSIGPGPFTTSSPTGNISTVVIAESTSSTTDTSDTLTRFIERADPTTRLPRYMNGNIYISGMRLNFSNSRFEIDYQKVNNNSTTASVVTRFVDGITFKSEGISTCYADLESVNNTLSREFCQSLGGLFTWSDNECRFSDLTCPGAGEIFVGISSTGAKICKTASSQADWENMIDPGINCNPTAPNTLVSLQYVGGKISIRCTSTGGGTTGSTTGGTTGGGCTPSVPCSTIASTYCPSAPTQNDSCGNNCGTGTKSSGCTPVSGSCSDFNSTPYQSYCLGSTTDTITTDFGAGTVTCSCEVTCEASSGAYCNPSVTGECGIDSYQCGSQGGPSGCIDTNTVLDAGWCGSHSTRCEWQYNVRSNCVQQ